ncbi:MAG: hypothetical protein ACEPOZ_13570 [Marinifilaceae bacterium]
MSDEGYLNYLSLRFVFYRNRKLLLFVILFLIILSGFYLYRFLQIGGWEYWLQSLVFFTWAFEFVLNYNGRSVNQIFGKSYLNFTEAGIHYKPRQWKQEQFIKWKEMEFVRFSSLQLDFQVQSGKTMNLELGNFSYKQILAIKDCVRERTTAFGIETGR